MRHPWFWRWGGAASALVVAGGCGRISYGGPAEVETDREASSDTFDLGEVGGGALVQEGLSVSIEDAPIFPVPVGERGEVRGAVDSEKHPADALAITWASDRDGALASPELEADGTWRWDMASLSAGRHRLRMEVTDPDGVSVSAETDVEVCAWPALEDFSSDPTGTTWRTYGDAYWDPRGFLEVTGNEPSRAGHIYKIDRKVDPGDFRLEFKIATGGGGNTGADGYAVNVVNVPDLAALETYIGHAGLGGCLGYGVIPACGAPADYEVSAFHIEFDTWHNDEYNDPIPGDTPAQNHIGILLDGDPSDHRVWAQVNLEDDSLAWKAIAVEASRNAQGNPVITIEVDGAVVQQQEMPGFAFEGGFLGVSGSTGWAYNHHRFDDLQIYDRCDVPE